MKNRDLETGWSFISKYAFLANLVMIEICVFKWVILAVYITVVFRSLNKKMDPFAQGTGYTQRKNSFVL